MNPFADLIPQKNKTSANNPFADLIPEKDPFAPKYKASIGGAGTILPNVAKTFGNIPSNAGYLIDTTLQSTAGNIGRSLKTVEDIYKEQGFKEGTKNIGKGFADVGTKIFKAPGEFLVKQSDKNNLIKDLKPIEDFAIKQRDEILTKITQYKKEGKDTKALVKALKYNQEQLGVLSEQIGTPEDRNLKDIDTVTKVFKYPIERPLDVPLAIETGGPKSNISKVASPVTRGADTSLLNIASKGKNLVTQPFNKAVSNAVPGAIDDLEAKYIEWSTGTKPGKKLVNKVEQKTDMLNNAGTEGRTPMRVLAEDGVVPKTTGTKFDTFDQAQEFRDSTTKLRELNKQAIKEAELSTPKVKLDDLESDALKLANTERNIASGDAAKLVRDIRSEFQELRNAYGDEIPLNQVNLIKEARWEKSFGNKGLIDADKLRKNSDYLIGKASQKTIENTARKAGNTELAQLNREIGDRIEAAKFLESLDGKTLKGGRVGKYVGTLIGSSLGQTIPGKIAGAIGGNAVADILIKSSVNSPIRRMILSRLRTQDPKAYQATLEWLIEQDIQRSMRLQLPAPGNQSTINQGRPIRIFPKSVEGNYTGKDVVAQSKSPTAQQTKPAITTVSKNPISSTIPKYNSKVNSLEQAKIDFENKLRKISPNQPESWYKYQIENQPFVKTPEKFGFIDKIKNIPNKEGGFVAAYKGEKDLTTKILKDLEGKTTVSKQYILDATNRGELKQVERDITRQVLDTMKGDTVNVKEFADKVKSELLPLKIKYESTEKPGLISNRNISGGRFENVSLPKEIRGKVKNYNEHIYESPIKTSAGSVHFGANDVENYFGHTRIEDMADNKTRRVIEVQSDLYQKGGLERHLTNAKDEIVKVGNTDWRVVVNANDGTYTLQAQIPREKMYKDGFQREYTFMGKKYYGTVPTEKVTLAEMKEKFPQLYSKLKDKLDAGSKLQQYNDPTAHFRMIREEIKKASQDGKTKLQFPTGETALKIEGIGERKTFTFGGEPININELKVGREIKDRTNMGDWTIIEVGEGGQFKAAPTNLVIGTLKQKFPNISGADIISYIKNCL